MATKPLVLVLGASHIYWLERLVASEVDFAQGKVLSARVWIVGSLSKAIGAVRLPLWNGTGFWPRWHSRLARRTYKQYRLATGLAD